MLEIERLLLRTKLTLMRNRLASLGRSQIQATAAVTCVLAAAWLGGCLLLYLGLRYVDQLADLGPLLTTRIFYLFFLTLMFLLPFSNLLIALGAFYRAPEVGFLVSKPIPSRSLFAARLVESVVDSSWPFLFMVGPVLVAFGIVRDAGVLYYLSSMLLLPPFIAILGCLGSGAALAIALIAPRLRPWQVGMVLAILAFTTGSFLWSRFNVQQLLAGKDLITMMERLAGALSGVQSPWFPSSWISRAILRTADGDLWEGVYGLALLSAQALALLAMLDALGHRLYHRAWTNTQGGGRSQGTIPEAGFALTPGDRLRARIATPGSPSHAALTLTAKDLRLFLRDPVQWGQMLLLGILLAIYIFSLLGMPGNQSNHFWQNVTVLMNRSTSVLLASVISSRFIFPLLSLEGRHRWILENSPLDRAGLIRQKLFTGLAPTAFMAALLLGISGMKFGLTWPEIALDLIFGASLATAVTALAVGFGAIWPDYVETNPARIINGVGGTLNFFVCLLVIAMAVTIDVGPMLLKTAEAAKHTTEHAFAPITPEDGPAGANDQGSAAGGRPLPSVRVLGALAARTVLVVLGCACLTTVVIRTGARHLESHEF